MKKFYFIPLLVSLLALLAGCSSPGQDGGQKTRTLKIAGPEAEVQKTETELSPKLLVDQTIANCEDNPKCHLETINEPYNNVGSPYRINSVIFADSDLMSGTNVQDAPAINFSTVDIDTSKIISTSITYTKKDSLGAIISQTVENQITGTDGSYNIPIHSSLMGSGILISAPYEKHILLIKIVTNSGDVSSFEIEFFLSSNTINPVIIERDPQIIDSAYYKMNEDLQSFLIDSVTLENTLPFIVSVAGEINLNNTTVAFVSESSKVQHKTFIPDTPGYPLDIYNWYTSTNTTHNISTALSTYIVKVEKNGTEEEAPITVTFNGLDAVLSISGLEITGTQKIKLNIYATLNTNSSILGDHGQETFFSGNSLCGTLSVNAKCNCFFAPTNIHDSSSTGSLFYNMAGMTMLQIKDLYYPNCGANVPNGMVTQQLSIVHYPASSVALEGRHHRTNASYAITTWLKGYENYDDFGTVSKTMDILEASKGFVDYTQVDPSLGYQGYIPGQI